MSQEITAQELAEIRLCHQSDDWADDPCCRTCKTPWPCDTSQVLAYFDFLTPTNLTRALDFVQHQGLGLEPVNYQRPGEIVNPQVLLSRLASAILLALLSSDLED
jgi:hypothetical protein